MELRWQELSLEVNVTVSHPFGGSIGGGEKALTDRTAKRWGHSESLEEDCHHLQAHYKLCKLKPFIQDTRGSEWLGFGEAPQGKA